MNERDIVSLLITKPFKIGIRFFLKKKGEAICILVCVYLVTNLIINDKVCKI